MLAFQLFSFRLPREWYKRHFLFEVENINFYYDVATEFHTP